MGTYRQVGQQIDTSFERAHEELGKFNAQLFGMVDQINKDFQANAKANKTIRENDALKYTKDYAGPLAEIEKTTSDPLNEKINLFARDIGDTEYQQTFDRQKLSEDDENYMSAMDGSNSRRKAMLVPGAMSQAAGAMEYYKNQYNAAMKITPGMTGSLNEKYTKNNNLLLVRDIVNNDGANITPRYNNKSGDVIWDYNDGEKQFSISNTEFIKGAQEGNSFLEFNGNPKDFVSGSTIEIVNQVDGNKELQTAKDTKYKSVTGVSYTGGMARTEKALQDYPWEAELNNPNMKNVARPILEGLTATPDSIITVPKIDMNKFEADGKTLNKNFGAQIMENNVPVNEDITFQQAYDEQKSLQYIANGKESVDENDNETPYTVRQKAIYKQAMIQEALKKENGFVKGDLEYKLTDKTKYVAPSPKVQSAEEKLKAKLLEKEVNKILERNDAAEKNAYVKDKLSSENIIDFLSNLTGGSYVQQGRRIVKLGVGDEENEFASLIAKDGTFQTDDNIAAINSGFMTEDFWEARKTTLGEGEKVLTVDEYLSEEIKD